MSGWGVDSARGLSWLSDRPPQETPTLPIEPVFYAVHCCVIRVFQRSHFARPGSWRALPRDVRRLILLIGVDRHFLETVFPIRGITLDIALQHEHAHTVL